MEAFVERPVRELGDEQKSAPVYRRRNRALPLWDGVDRSQEQQGERDRRGACRGDGDEQEEGRRRRSGPYGRVLSGVERGGDAEPDADREGAGRGR